ncbi:MAG TPA: hypothetical protein VJ922_07390 [Actinomycetota bacterium]|nr:hypothetical protein [Actinomycetota bacterium]
MTTPFARRFLAVLEPIVSMIYFSPEGFEEYAALGITDGWAGYFRSRSAAMGAVSAEVVAATFYNFNPALVRRSIAWDVPPEDVYAARLRAARRTLERLLGDESGFDLETTSRLLRPLVEACPMEGRPIAAPHAALQWPDDPLLGTWHGANVLREFRGDGHVAALMLHGIAPVEALLLQVGYMGLSGKAREWFFLTREWDEAAQKESAAVLMDRGFLDADGALTDGGGKFRGMLEHDTDRAAAAPFVAAGGERCEEILRLLEPIANKVLAERGVPRNLGRMDPANPLGSA